MKYFAQGLLTLLMGLFVLSSCEKADTIGLDIDPQDTINGKFVTEYNIHTVTVKDDSLLTDALSQYPLGDLHDSEIGDTKAGIALGLNIPTTTFDINAAGLYLDSAVLVLPYGRGLEGDSTTFDIAVSQLDEKYTSGTYSTKKWKVGTEKWTKNTRFAWNDSIRVMEIVKEGRDTLRKVPPQLRVQIDTTKMRTMLKASTMTSNALFASTFKGLYLSAAKTGEKGGVGFLNLVTSSTSGQGARLDLYYRAKNSSGTQDTSIATFAVGGATAAIEHAYKSGNGGIYPGDQLKAPGQTFPTVYVQAMGGLKTKVTFPDLKKLKELGNIAINKAELVVSSISNTNDLAPAPALAIYQNDIAGQRQPLPDQTSQWGGTFYNPTQKRYVFNISSYVQHILSGKTEQYPLFIIGADPRFLTQGAANITPVATTAARAVLAGGNSLASKIKLNIYYTRLQ